MHEIAVAPSITLIHFILSAAGFSEISYRRELSYNWFASVESASQALHGLFRALFLVKFTINIAKQVVRDVIANVKLVNFPKFRKLFIDVFIKFFKLLFRFDKISIWV